MFFQYKVYVGCAVSSASPEFLAEIESLRKKLELFCTVLRFHGRTDHTPTETYQHDIDQVYEGDLMLAICDYHSIGLGIEIGTRIALGKPTLSVAQKNHTVGKMTEGVTDPSYVFKRYNRLIEDVPPLVLEMLERIDQTNSLSVQS